MSSLLRQEKSGVLYARKHCQDVFLWWQNMRSKSFYKSMPFRDMKILRRFYMGGSFIPDSTFSKTFPVKTYAKDRTLYPMKSINRDYTSEKRYYYPPPS